MADDERPRRRRGSGRLPVARIGLALAVAGPALLIGGVVPITVVLFLGAVAILWARLCTRTSEPLHVPRVAVFGALAAAVTLVQWLPVPGLRAVLAPGLDLQVTEALVGTGIVSPAGLSVATADTALEVARLTGLTLLTIAAAQISWRTTAAIIAGGGTLVALLGMAHEAGGIHDIYGVYVAHDVDLSETAALLGTFVNPNHQSGFLLLGIFCAAALAADQHSNGLTTRDPSKVDRYGDRFLVAMASIAVQLPALVLSLSRAALVVFVVIAPFAIWFGLRRQLPDRSEERRRSRHLSPMRLVVAAGLVGLMLLVAQHGAWRELSTLLDVASGDPATETKLRIAGESLQLVALSPALGIGRGGFRDTFAAFDSEPSHVLATHLECAPVAMIVEWGPAVGGLMIVGAAAWWISAFRHGGPRNDVHARRIVLLGVLAVALQNTVDFAFEFLGVAAPVCAIVGATALPRAWRLPCRASLRIGLGLLAGAAILAIWAIPGTWTRRGLRDQGIVPGTADPASILQERPLDGWVHQLWARRAANDADWEQARARASVAVRLRPGEIDAWLLLSAAMRQTGGTEAEADAAIRQALPLAYEAFKPEVIQYLLQRYPNPKALAEFSPKAREPWKLLVLGLIEPAPVHADSVAAARQAVVPDDPLPLEFRTRIALTLQNPALALHHARLLRAIAPDAASSHLAVARALLGFEPRRIADVRDAMVEGLARPAITDSAERGVLEEQLLRALLNLGDAESVAQARDLVPRLLARPATRQVRRNREQLVRKLEGLEAGE